MTGIVHKDSGFEELVHCIREAAAGRRWLSSTIADAVAKHRQPARSFKELRAKLTVREQEIIGLVSRGLSNKEIARKLDLSEGTVKIHLHNIFKKVSVSNRTALAALAVKGGASSKHQFR